VKPLLDGKNAVREVEHLLHPFQPIECGRAEIEHMKFRLWPIKRLIPVNRDSAWAIVDCSLVFVQLLENLESIKRGYFLDLCQCETPVTI
jgi:hypothetical protein